MSTTHTINLQEATDDSQSASIAAIKTKTDKIIIDLSSSNLNLNTMNNDLTAAAAINTTQNAQLAMTSESSMKTAIDLNTAKTGISASEANIITANANKLNMTVNSAMKIAVDANTSDVSFLTSRFPRQNIIRRYAYTTGDIYSDEKVKFNWDGTNRQLRFWILNISTGKYMAGGVERWEGVQSTRVANYISQNVSTYYHYFTAPQLSGAILNTSIN